MLQMSRKAVAGVKGWICPYFSEAILIYITWGSCLKHSGHGNLSNPSERREKKKSAFKNHHYYCQNLILLRQQNVLMLHWICPFLWFSLPSVQDTVFWSRLLKEILFHTSLRSLSESYVLRALICRIVPRVHLRWAQKFSSGNYPFFPSELRNQEFLLIWQKCRFSSLTPVTCETSHTGKSQTVPLCPI